MAYVSNNLIGNLHIARQALSAQQAGLNLVGQNVANLNTEGYTRKRVILSAAEMNSGVTIDGVHRYVDQFANKRLVEEESLLGFYNQKSDVLGHVSELFNDLQDTGLGNAFDAFFGSLRTLESNPGDLTSRQEVLARGEELSGAFRRISYEMEEVRRGMDDLLRASVSEINVRVEEIASLNERIAFAKAMGHDASDNEDTRDRLVQEISEHADINYIQSDKGEYTVFLEGGMPLVEGKHFSTLFVSPIAAPGSAEVEYVTQNGAQVVITSRIQGGRLGGAVEVRDRDIPGYQADMDQLAYDIVDAVNGQHQAGFGMDGITGRLFFDDPGGTVAGAALNMRVSADVDGMPDRIAAAGLPTAHHGDNENAILMANLSEQLLAGGGAMTMNEAYGTIVGKVGVEARRANDSVAMRSNTIKSVETIRDSKAGVSLDEELSFMLAYQRAYQASAKVVSATDEVIQTLLGMKG